MYISSYIYVFVGENKTRIDFPFSSTKISLPLSLYFYYCDYFIYFITFPYQILVWYLFYLCSCYLKSPCPVYSLYMINPFDYLHKVSSYSSKIIFTLVVPLNLSSCFRCCVGGEIIFQLYTLFVASFTNRLNRLKTTTNSEI